MSKNINPLESNLESFLQVHKESKCEDLDKITTLDRGVGDELKIKLKCKNCKTHLEETYLLDYTEREDNKRWSRNEIPECTCKSENIKEEKIKDKETKIIIFSICNSCGTKFQDHYSYVDL